MSGVTHRTLTTTAEIESYLHRTRMAILVALRGGPATVTQIAATLGVHPANLTRHIRSLEDAGLIALVEKRDTGRNLEKYYRAAATTFDVAPEAGDLAARHKIALAFVRSDISAALASLPDVEPRPVVAYVVSARVAPADLGLFQERLAALVEAFSAANSANADEGDTYHLNLSLYPGPEPADGVGRVTLTGEAPKEPSTG
jgi:DNA-binding transcriptional ArsR family regulator